MAPWLGTLVSTPNLLRICMAVSGPPLTTVSLLLVGPLAISEFLMLELEQQGMVSKIIPPLSKLATKLQKDPLSLLPSMATMDSSSSSLPTQKSLTQGHPIN